MSALMVLVVMLGHAPTKVEVTLFPAAVQLNGMFTQTAGTFGAVSVRVREGVSLQVFGGGNWLSQQSRFNEELAYKANYTAQPVALVTWTWAVLAGLELEPLVGTLSVFGTQMKFSLTLGAGLGGGGSRLRLGTQRDGRELYGDAGGRFMGMVSSGLRVEMGHFVFRAEIRDVMFNSRLSTLNGCTAGDAYVLDGNFGTRPDGYPQEGTSADCRGFVSSDISARVASTANKWLSLNESDVLVNIGAYVGLGVVF